MGELVATLRRLGEIDVSDELADALTAMSPATMDRRQAPDRAAMTLRGRSHTKPVSLFKDAIAIRTWAQWDDAAPGFVEIDLVGNEGGNAIGEHAYTLTVTDIATGWTENRSVPNKARKWVIAALADIAKVLPFPLLGIDSDNGSDVVPACGSCRLRDRAALVERHCHRHGTSDVLASAQGCDRMLGMVRDWRIDMHSVELGVCDHVLETRKSTLYAEGVPDAVEGVLASLADRIHSRIGVVTLESG